MILRVIPVVVAVAALAGMPVAANSSHDQVTSQLALGACAAAASAAEQVQTEASDDASLADALALRTRVALDCRRPQTPGIEDWLSRERDLRIKANGTDAPSVAMVELERIRREQQLNHLDDARAAASVLNERAEKLHWPATLRGRIAARIASIALQRSDLKTAFDESGRAIEIARPAHEDSTLVSALEDRAYALARMRRGEEAVPLADEAKRIAKTYFGAQSREYAEALRVHAQCARIAGDFGTATDGVEQAIAVMRGQAEPDSREIANALMNLGQTQKVSGDGVRAIKSYEAALAADGIEADTLRPTRAITLHGLANLERDSGNYARAVELYTQAEPVFSEFYGAQSTRLAQVLNNHGNAEANLDHYDKANALYQRAVDIARASQSEDPGDWWPLGNLAMVQVWQGRYVEAESGFREMMQHQKSAGTGSEVSTLFPSMGLAASLWGQLHFDEALEAALAAERVRESALTLAASHLGEQQSIDLQEYLRPSMDLVVSIAVASGKPQHLERAWLAGMAARDQVTSILAQRLSAARGTRDPALAALWNEWRAASGALASSELTHADPGKRSEARERLDRAERALARATPLAASVTAAQLDFASLRAALPIDESLVLFTTSHLRTASDFSRDESEKRAADLYAFVLPRRDAQVKSLRLGSLDAIGTEIDTWIAALADPHVALATVAERGAVVKRSLWQPIHDAGAGAHWLVLPTDALYRVPWAALPDGDGFLADQRFRAHALNHERELLESPATEAQPRLLAVADPLVDANLPARMCAAGLPTLPGARRESKALEAMWRAHYGDDSTSTLLVGAQATEAKLRAVAASADIVHFGTHGIRLGGDCARSTEAMAVRGFSLAADAPLDTKEPALAPAALLLATGAKNAGSDDDGLLTAEEIAALDLTHARWAVLAACSTAAGATHRYEGLFGLARAFRLAGVRTVLTSLWPVDDAATAEWSQALYAARIERGLDTAASMAEAQRTVLTARRERGESVHPYYWAAFVANGDWR